MLNVNNRVIKTNKHNMQKLDITSMLPPGNKAGQALADILIRDGKDELFSKVVFLISKYCEKNQVLVDKNITNQYFYDLIFKDYKARIPKIITNEKYASYVLNILSTKYRLYLEKISIDDTSESDKPDDEVDLANDFEGEVF